MLCALIMAGGKGTRFWPLSTEEKPKQFLNLIGNETMIQMTVNRIKPIIPIERIFVCTGEKYVHLVREQLPELPLRNIITEPEGRNTAPCISLSAFMIERYYRNATMVVLPSDHLISKEEEFRSIIMSCHKYLDEFSNSIMTIGVNPDRAEIGYGYIELGKTKSIKDDFKVSRVNRFVEKPNIIKAEQYLESGNFLWNAGVFIWKVDCILNNIKEHMPDTYFALKGIKNINEHEIYEYVRNNYLKTEAISIDYGILEKSKDIFVIHCNIGWDDVGSWESIERYREKDNMGNIYLGNINSIKSSNNLIVASNQDIVIDGVSDIYVVESNGKIVIGKKENINNLKDLKKIV